VPNLERFGFTPTETRVYEVLLRLGASTGYAVSKESGLARANTYQALDGLVRRGAARRSATIPAKYAALAPEAVVAELERGLRRDLETLQRELQALPRGSRSEGGAIHVSETWVDFIERAVAAVSRAREEVMAVVGPWAGPLLDALTTAAARGVAVRALSLGEAGDRPGITVRSIGADELVPYWSGYPVAVVVDRVEAMSAILFPDGSGGGVAATHAAVVPFVRHLLRRELAGVP
jgi:sugar-specific transcriptional regulator TrmB